MSDPNQPSSGVSPFGLSDVEVTALAALNRAFTGMHRLYTIIRNPKVAKSIKASTLLFKAIGKAGEHARELTKTFELTKSLISMPTRTATQGLDMLSSQLLAPMTGAVTQAIGQMSAIINQTLGPVLQQIGQSIGGFVRANPVGAGIGGTIGGIAGAVTGIPGLGLVGGIVGAGIEALGRFSAARAKPAIPDDLRERFQTALDQGMSFEDMAKAIRFGGGAFGITIPGAFDTEEKIRTFMGVPSTTQELAQGAGAGISIGGREVVSGGETVDIGGGVGGIDPGAMVSQLQETNITLRRMFFLQQSTWG